MLFYRYYCLDITGKTIAVKSFAAQDDAEAFRIAAQLQTDEQWHDIEIWEQFRSLTRPQASDRLVRKAHLTSSGIG